MASYMALAMVKQFVVFPVVAKQDLEKFIVTVSIISAIELAIYSIAGAASDIHSREHAQKVNPGICIFSLLGVVMIGVMVPLSALGLLVFVLAFSVCLLNQLQIRRWQHQDNFYSGVIFNIFRSIFYITFIWSERYEVALVLWLLIEVFLYFFFSRRSFSGFSAAVIRSDHIYCVVAFISIGLIFRGEVIFSGRFPASELVAGFAVISLISMPANMFLGTPLLCAIRDGSARGLVTIKTLSVMILYPVLAYFFMDWLYQFLYGGEFPISKELAMLAIVVSILVVPARTYIIMTESGKSLLMVLVFGAFLGVVLSIPFLLEGFYSDFINIIVLGIAMKVGIFIAVLLNRLRHGW
ncbi:hypothetical protein [uncultured Spongiibacter sp.]|uniref:hypothetical protein n=1 Tax=uncultured Spongiibacter sp. TaxID=870896 RepID=UPI0025950984|nr:hypothetical protein [uncultured Spongiibacter sp.]